MTNPTTAEREEAVELSGRFLHGELTTLVVDEFKRMIVGWDAMTQQMQDEKISRTGKRIAEITKETVNILAGMGRPTVLGEVDSATFKGGVKVVVKLSKLQRDRHYIADAQGQAVLLVLPAYDEILNGDMPKGRPDQASLEGMETEGKGAPGPAEDPDDEDE